VARGGVRPAIAEQSAAANARDCRGRLWDCSKCWGCGRQTDRRRLDRPQPAPSGESQRAAADDGL